MSIESIQHNRGGSFIGAIFLVSGTCIGAGMLALPLVTGISGILPTLFVNFICWIFMLATGLLFLEATLWMPEGAHVLSMADRYLGQIGKWIGGVTFLFLYSSLMVAYLAGATSLVQDLLPSIFDGNGALSFIVILFGAFALLGTRFAGRINEILVVGLIVSYLFLTWIGIQGIDGQLFRHSHWGLAIWAFPTLISAFGFHNIIPTLTTYLQRDRAQLRWAIIIGTAIPWLVYSVWQAILIGIIPLEELKIAAEKGVQVSSLLLFNGEHSWMSFFTALFSFFAIVTSLIGVSLSMVDFLGDGFHIKNRKGWNRLFLCALVFLFPAAIAATYPSLFLEMLGIAGGIGEAILNGFLPVLFVWIGRYSLQLERSDQIPGGKLSLVSLFLFSLLVFSVELAHLYNKILT